MTDHAARLMSSQDVADYYSVPVHTIYGWRATGKGPRAFRVGKHLRFKRSDVDAWLERQGDPLAPGGNDAA